MVELSSLLSECLDAFSLRDNQFRDQHVHYLAEALANQGNRAHALLLARIRDTFKRSAQMDVFELAARPDPEIGPLMADISAVLKRLSGPKYLYHGTIQGRLKSIAQEGLQPDKNIVWRETDLRAHITGKVFFATSWRGAARWADAAHAFARGPKGGRHRRQAVVRVRSETLSAGKDLLARAHDCVSITGPISTDGAEVFIGPLEGWPTWQPIERFL